MAKSYRAQLFGTLSALVAVPAERNGVAVEDLRGSLLADDGKTYTLVFYAGNRAKPELEGLVAEGDVALYGSVVERADGEKVFSVLGPVLSDEQRAERQAAYAARPAEEKDAAAPMRTRNRRPAAPATATAAPADAITIGAAAGERAHYTLKGRITKLVPARQASKTAEGHDHFGTFRYAGRDGKLRTVLLTIRAKYLPVVGDTIRAAGDAGEVSLRGFFTDEPVKRGDKPAIDSFIVDGLGRRPAAAEEMAHAA